MTYGIARKGICGTCGRPSTGYLREDSLRECEDPCPRCGCTPFYLDSIAPWSDNIAKMETAEALAFVAELDYDAEIEVLFRVELLGPDRDEVLEALHDRYWAVHDVPPEATARGRRMTLDELRAAWWKELENPDSLRYYETLVREGELLPDPVGVISNVKR